MESVLLPNQNPEVRTKSVGVDLAGAIHPNSLVDGDNFFPGQPLLVVYHEDLHPGIVRLLLEKAILHFGGDDLW